MKYNGLPLSAPSAVSIDWVRSDGTELVLQLRPLPLGFQRRLALRGIVAPPPPLGVARDARGRPLRDEQDRPVTLPDEHAPRYQHDVAQYHQRVAVLVVAEGLRDDSSFTWETPRPDDDQRDWSDYADRLLHELEQAGWSDGDLVSICEEISRLSRTFGEQLRAARGNSSAPADPT